jgi:CP family cyanate transporter-like MFS transporter
MRHAEDTLGEVYLTRGEPVVSEPGRATNPYSSRVRAVLLVLGILLLAANLRAALTGVAPLIGQIRTDTGVSNGVAGLLTALPLVAFGVLSPLAPVLARRIGIERALFASLFVLAAGILLRSAGSVAALFLGTAVLGAAIAAGNVLLPSLVKQEFPERTGLMTSAYSTTMGVAAALAAGASAPVAYGLGLGWRASLALWALLALTAIIVWIPLVRGARPSDAFAPASRRAVSLWRSSLAWQVTIFMGLQSLVYYVTLTWLPEILRDEGLSASRAGWMLALAQAVGIATMFLAPMIASSRPSQRRVVAAAVILNGGGTLGLLVAGGTAPALWVVLLGLGQGACFSLALTFFALRAPNSEHAAALSGMAQSVGYLLAASGPSLFGALRDATGDWNIPLALLLALTVCLLLTGLGAARDAQVVTGPETSSDGSISNSLK